MLKASNENYIVIYYFFLAGLLLAFGGTVSAQVADLELRKGLVKIIRGDDVQIINKLGFKLPLLNGDRVQTGANSKAVITLIFSKRSNSAVFTLVF